MDGVMNLCRVKFRDHQRLTRQELAEYSVPTYQGMGDVPRAGNDSGGGQLGNAIHCKPHGANDWLYVVVQEAVWDALAKRIGPDVQHARPRDRPATSPPSPSAARTRRWCGRCSTSSPRSTPSASSWRS